MVNEKIKKPPRKTSKDKLIETKISSFTNSEISQINGEVLSLEIENDPKYSLVVDPENKYNMNDMQKEFVKNYVQFKNFNVVAKIMNMDVENIIELWKSYSITQEINRINNAIYVRNFNKKMISLDNIGGYLTAVLTDQVPEADKLSTKDKLPVVKLLMELNQMKTDIHNNPNIIDEMEIERNIKDLSVKSIKQLLLTSHNESREDKEEIINQINKDNLLSPQELAMLNSLSTKELLELLEEINKKGKRR